jgi:hypothetical protein
VNNTGLRGVGRLDVGGRRVVVRNGTRTQTVNVWPGLDESSTKTFVVRTRWPRFTSTEELEAKAFVTVDELTEYLVAEHKGEVEEPKDRVWEQFSQRLAGIADDLQASVPVPPTTVRAFLDWVDVKRRRPAVVDALRQHLADNGLATDPDFEAAFIDSPISFVIAPEEPVITSPDGSSPAVGESFEEPDAPDPAYLVSRLKTFDGVYDSVPPTESLAFVITKMLADGLSHLPVMTGRRDAKGVISWKGIGQRLALGRDRGTVGEFMDAYVEVEISDALSTLIERVTRHDFVLVRDRRHGNEIVGTVSAGDLNHQLDNLSRPFLLIGEIERHLRRLIAPCLSAEDFKGALDDNDPGAGDRAFGNLSLGECQRWLEMQENWEKVGLPLDRAEFTRRLGQVRDIRNSVMHFNSDAIDADIKTLVGFAQLLQGLRDMGTTCQ